MSRKSIFSWISGMALLLATCLVVPDAVAEKGGKGGGGKGGGNASGGRGGGGQSARSGGGQRGRSSGQADSGRSSRSAVGQSNARTSRSSVSGNVRVGRGPTSYGRPGYAANSRFGVGYGRGGFYGGGFYAGWGRPGGFYYPWRFGIGFGAPWYWSRGYGGGAYGGYSAPYYTFYPYAGDVPVTNPSDSPMDYQSSNSQENEFLRDAEAAFHEGNYDEAVRLTHHALVESPEDGRLHLFAAQAMFAVGDYEGAAAAIHQGASFLPDSEWGYIVENYQRYYRGRDFVEQMDQLDKFISEKPDAAYAHFVRGFEHGFLGHREMAIKNLTKAMELENRDELAGRLIERFGGVAPAVGSSNREPATLPVPPSEGANFQPAEAP